MAVLAVIAIVVAMVLIGWVRLEVHGTEDIEAALAEPAEVGELPVLPAPDTRTSEEREVDAAVTSSRFATGFSP